MSEAAARAALGRVNDELDFATRAVGMLDRVNSSMGDVSEAVRRMAIDLRRAMASEPDAGSAVVRVLAEVDAVEEFYGLAQQFDSCLASPAAAAAARELIFALRSALGVSTRPRA
ncbi:hypothetical protein QUV83_11775 [Cellulomonas cellasea]|uniref:hypothetical protein n=1 Tax=Cellulomonas cellasea TaxID=43670 RepID=UPI0025A47FF8|nr:hypothetical protein [Cellulomonas cellasea]MDM8085445.1 hypothetical protein [Cellulomonas cellasea]